ncbi:MAG: alpha/beta fold hydrolase [Propionibacteriales bacterium]|nr:alpha/beta fold hydrolase [Propionibacteriales bacterium]
MTELEVAYTRRGTGSPLILVHGIGHRRQAWDPVLDLLAEHHDVIAVDLPGFGESPGLPAGLDYDMDTAMDNFAKMFAQWGIPRPHIAGNSLGGALALELAGRGLVSTATALSPAGFWTPGQRRYAISMLSAMRRSAMLPAGVVERIARSPWQRALALKPIHEHGQRLSADDFLADARSMAEAVAFGPTARAGRNYDFEGVPQVPVTVAWGTRDRILLPKQAALARRILPMATHIPLPGCGHVPMLDDPELVAGVILDTAGRAG